jgi:phosphoenolpyruvate-protein kinase (PTS system EI component)
MVETPAAAVAADTLASEVAFFSIGTNDLVQYTLAVDRGNANLAARFTPLHPAVLRLIRRTVEVAEAHGIEVAVCGEMASHPLMAVTLLGLGLRQMSVNPRAVAAIKRVFRAVSAERARAVATEALAAPNAAEAEAIVSRYLREAIGPNASVVAGLLGG